MRQQGHRSGYSKIENNQQEASVDHLVRIAKNFGMTVDEVIYFGERTDLPEEVTFVKDKADYEKFQLINELDIEEKNILFKLIETFASKKRFKDYLQQNIASL